MIPYNPIHSFNLGPLTFKTWGFFVAIAFLVAIELIRRHAKHINQKHINNIALLAMIGGIIGARIGYVIINLREFSSFLDMLAIWNGGMAFFGGLIAATLLILLYLKKHRLDSWRILDSMAPGVALGHAIGRVGCIFAGFHIGKITNVPWAVNYLGQPRHPTPIYSIIHLSIMFYGLMKFRTKKLFDGAIVLIYLIWYSLGRFIIEFFRIEAGIFGLTYTQWITLIVAVTALYILVKKSKEHGLGLKHFFGTSENNQN